MSKLLKCIIVDDEPPAIRLLQKYIDKASFINLEDSFTNPLLALQYIEQNEVDVLFLDIQMPEITGLQLSKIINKDVQIIFTTAYAEFALESYELNAKDYLLKPIDFERFYKAILKVKENPSQKNKTASTTNDFIFFKTEGKNKLSKVFLNEIRYIESLKNYVAIHLEKEEVINYNTLKSIKESLSEDFIQIHKSYIISIKHIDKVENDSVWINQKELSIGNTYKKLFFEKISNFKL